MKTDSLLRYAYHAWPKHARNSLDDMLAAGEVKAFVRGCRSFPLMLHCGNYVRMWDLLGPLHVAAYFGLPISLAGSNSTKPNCRTLRWKETPLHLACRQASSFSTVQELLLLPSIDLNAANRLQETPLVWACHSGNMNAVKLLLNQPNLKLNRVADDRGRTAFTRAAAESNETMVTAILTHSPTMIHSTDRRRRTALSWACEEGSFAMVKLLLSHSQSEVRLADASGRTTLSYASESDSVDVFNLILSLAPEDVYSADRQGRTPLSWAASDGGQEAFKILLTYPETDVNQVDKNGRTPLSHGSEAFYAHQRVELLLANPLTEVNLADTSGRTPLMWAAKWDRASTTEVLLGHPQTDVNRQDNKGRTPLTLACCRFMEIWEAWQIIRNLLAHPNIKVNLPDSKGRTPLIQITMPKPRPEDVESLRNMKAVCQMLLAHPQTDVNLVDNKGRTALSWASLRGHKDLVELLGHTQTQVEPDRGFGQLLDSAARGLRDLWNK
jgi:ankyrin repeat domain-containing protein 50